MNCGPNQRAWIDVPQTAGVKALGMDQLHGHVVETVELSPRTTSLGAWWVVKPQQHLVVRRIDIAIGERKGVLTNVRVPMPAIPDAWLRPFQDFPPDEVLERPLERVS